MTDLPYEVQVDIVAPAPSTYDHCTDPEGLSYPCIGQAIPSLGANTRTLAVMPGKTYQMRDQMAGFMKVHWDLVKELDRVEVEETVVLDMYSFGSDKAEAMVLDVFYPDQPDLDFLQRFPRARETFKKVKKLDFALSVIIPSFAHIKEGADRLATEVGTMYSLPQLVLKPHPLPFSADKENRFFYIDYLAQ